MKYVWLALLLATLTDLTECTGSAGCGFKPRTSNHKCPSELNIPKNYTNNANNNNNDANNKSVQLFQQYIQINSTNGGNLTEAVEFWKSLAAKENVPINVYEYVEGKPVVVIKWAGSNSNLSSIMLNSHMDVVPASESDGWTYPPFSGQLTEDGDIWGRGTQDMKSVSLQYFEALKRIKAKKITLLRDVYMTLIPDEETGSAGGMQLFLKSDEFAAMNVGFEMDEGTSYDAPYYIAFYQDKSVWDIQITCNGTGGHGSTLLAFNDSAIGKCYNVMTTLFKFREEQYDIYVRSSILNAGNYTSLNLNRMWGGTANNVIPNSMSFVCNLRLKTTINETEFKERLSSWIEAAGDNITLEYLSKDVQTPATILNSTNPYWTTFQSVASSLNMTLLSVLPPGSTDARWLRLSGVPAFGFSPMPNTKPLLHSVDEHLNATTFLNGIDIYEQLIPAFANLAESVVDTDPSVYIVETATSS